MIAEPGVSHLTIALKKGPSSYDRIVHRMTDHNSSACTCPIVQRTGTPSLSASSSNASRASTPSTRYARPPPPCRHACGWPAGGEASLAHASTRCCPTLRASCVTLSDPPPSPRANSPSNPSALALVSASDSRELARSHHHRRLPVFALLVAGASSCRDVRWWFCVRLRVGLWRGELP